MFMIKQIKNLRHKISAWLDWYPPGSLTSKGWRLFRQEFKEQAPIRYWLMHDFRYAVILPIQWKYRAINDWVRYRTYDRYHVVKTGLQPDYYGFEDRSIHACFNMLKDFIEVEKSWNSFVCDENRSETWYEKYVPFYWKFVEFRRPDLGIAYLEWEATLDDPNLPPSQQSPHQAVSAREQLALYKWWTETRPSRKEEDVWEYSDQGLGILSVLDDDFDHEAEDYKISHEAMERNEKLREQWDKEDEDMFIRLVKLRKALWT